MNGRGKYRWLATLAQFAVIVIVIGSIIWAVMVYTSRLSAPGPLPDGWTVYADGFRTLAIVERDGIMWAGGRDGLVGLDRETGQIVEEPQNDPPFEFVFSLVIDDENILWIAHNSGLTRYDGNAFHTLTEADGLPSNHVRSLAVDGSGRLWVGTLYGAAVMENGIFTVMGVNDGLPDEMVNVILCDSLGGVWFGSYSAPEGGIGILRHDGEVQFFNVENGLPHTDVTYLYEESEGVVWAGTGLVDRGGACRFEWNGNEWTISEVLDESNGLAANKVRSIFSDSAGSFWFGHEYDGVTRITEGNIEFFNKSTGLPGNEVTCIIQDSTGAIWLGTLAGIVRIDADYRV